MKRNTSWQTSIQSESHINCQAQSLMDRVESLTEAVNALTLIVLRTQGIRITREQLAERLGVHRNTVRTLISRDPRFPRSDRTGKWLLSEIVEWEQHK
ncbi:MAG: DNA-binding protein [Alcaligenaceae bacterium]|nr:MAG: DNA-binding protein [Alcaligenaceae bacterium]